MPLRRGADLFTTTQVGWGLRFHSVQRNPNSTWREFPHEQYDTQEEANELRESIIGVHNQPEYHRLRYLCMQVDHIQTIVKHLLDKLVKFFQK